MSAFLTLRTRFIFSHILSFLSCFVFPKQTDDDVVDDELVSDLHKMTSIGLWLIPTIAATVAATIAPCTHS